MDLSQVSKGGKMKPPRILIYGQAGIGKTSFGAAAPKPIFLPIEDGLGKIDADAFPCPKSYTEVRDSLDALIKEDHDCRGSSVWGLVCAANRAMQAANGGCEAAGLSS